MGFMRELFGSKSEGSISGGSESLSDTSSIRAWRDMMDYVMKRSKYGDSVGSACERSGSVRYVCEAGHLKIWSMRCM